MKGYVYLLLIASLVFADAATWGYPDLEKGEGSQPQSLNVAPAALGDEEGMMADAPAAPVATTDDPDDDDDDEDDTTTDALETTTDNNNDDDDDDDGDNNNEDDDNDDDDDDDFPQWGDKCDNGKYQSPIALSREHSLKTHYPNFAFEDFDDELKDARIVNNGHTVQIEKFTNSPTVTGPVLPGTFIMEQMHFHWPSEHTIEKFRYPLELHIVHRNKKYANISEAAKHPDGIAVFAVLFHASMREHKEIAQILDRVDDVADSKHINSERSLEGIEVRNLMPKDINDEYFSYKGSLTTPSCAESVTWIVYENTLPVTMKQIEEFEQVEESDGDRIKNNYRFIQKTSGRKVLYIADDDDDGEDGIDDDNDGINDDEDDDLNTNALDGGAFSAHSGYSIFAILITLITCFVNSNRQITI